MWPLELAGGSCVLAASPALSLTGSGRHRRVLAPVASPTAQQLPLPLRNSWKMRPDISFPLWRGLSDPCPPPQQGPVPFDCGCSPDMPPLHAAR